MKEKVKATIGVFGGIFKNRKILVRRRTEIPSLIPGKSFKGCWELPGGGAMIAEEMPYHYLTKELARRVEEETGIKLALNDLMPEMYPVFFGKHLDLAMVVPVETSLEPTKGENKWISLEELNKLAEEYKPANKETGEDGEGLVSGIGKRMHCMALQAFCVLGDQEDAIKAKIQLTDIQKNW